MGKWGGAEVTPEALMAAMKLLQGKGAGKASGGKNGGWGSGAGNQQPKKVKAAPDSYKSRLCEAYAKTHKEMITKETIVYEVVESGDKEFTATVSCEKFKDIYSATAGSKKEAQELAAKKAVNKEFPNFFSGAPAVKKAPPAAEKTKAATPGGGTINADPKSKLNNGLMIILGRSPTKDEVSYTVEEQNGSMVATVTVLCVDGRSFIGNSKGVDKESKKKAVHAAATKALNAYRGQINQMKPEREAARAEKKAAYEAQKAAAAES